MVAIPAIWLATGLAISLVAVCAFITIVFVALWIALSAAAFFIRGLIDAVTGSSHD